MKQRLTLYGTSACHLCEEAQGLLCATLNPAFFVLEWVDIADDDRLLDRYGVRIPVLQREDGAELGWPFDVDGVMAFLS